MTETGQDPNADTGRRLREQFEAYFLGLIFTLLALSIQTAHFGKAPVADLLELSGWVLLLVAGLAGLSRAEWLPVLYYHASERNRRTETEITVRQAMWAGTREVYDERMQGSTPAEEYAGGVKRAADKIKVKMRTIEKRQYLKYRVMKWSFVAAVISLIAARGGPALVEAVHHLPH